MKKTTLFDLFWTFFKIGAFTFGGGFAMLPLIEREVVTNKKWNTDSEMMDMLIISESTPGVFAVNMATSVGFRTRGVWGAIVATLGVVLPSFVIILALSFVLDTFKDNNWYKAAFTGIQICVCTLVLNAFLRVSKTVEKDVFNFTVLAASFFVALLTNFNVVYLILIGAALGLTVSLLKDKINKSKQKNLTSAVLPDIMASGGNLQPPETAGKPGNDGAHLHSDDSINSASQEDSKESK